MKRLMKVSDIVNQKTKSERFLLLCAINSLSDIPINEIVFVVTCSTQPIVDVFNGLHDAIRVILEARIVIHVSALVKKRCVNEVPVVLPLLPGLLDLVSECCALYERVVLLRADRALVR
jgi:hypothetical protein